jgi:hypothetical protein
MWQHNYEPVAAASARRRSSPPFPIVVLFLMLGVLRKPAWMSALGGARLGAVVALGRLRHAAQAR